MSLQKFCQRPVVTVSPEMTITEACQLMWEKNVGCVMAMEAGRLCGILTDRDAALRVVRERKDPQQTTVREVMTPNPVCIGVDKTLHELTTLMRQHHVRRAPIVDAGNRPIGIVTFDDLLALLSQEMSDMGQTVSATFFRTQLDGPPAFSSPQEYWWSAYMPLSTQSERQAADGQLSVEAFYHKLADQRLYEWSVLCDSV